MTKNSSNADKLTVTVLSMDGSKAGLTYPKRAAGLVRKGRARFVNDNTIRLEYGVSDVIDLTEDIKMDNNINTTAAQPINKLYFNAREWSFNKSCSQNVGNRSFMQGPDGVITEAFTIGNWGYDWTEIMTKSLMLPKNTLHTFTFWLNGGENDCADEVCRLDIIFDDDWENRYSFNLNRGYIKPLKKYHGWELYEIPFVTSDNEYTQLRFVAQRAYMTVMGARDAVEYEDLPDTPDEFEGIRPQRHNIVFDDGFPTDKWYSTANLTRERQKGSDGSAARETAAENPAPSLNVDRFVERVLFSKKLLNTDDIVDRVVERIHSSEKPSASSGTESSDDTAL